MTAAPAGAVVSLYMDTPHRIEPGDVIETGTGRRYEVLTLRVQARGAHAGRRKHMRCRVLGADEPLDPDVRLHPLRWYGRARRPPAVDGAVENYTGVIRSHAADLTV